MLLSGTQIILWWITALVSEPVRATRWKWRKITSRCASRALTSVRKVSAIHKGCSHVDIMNMMMQKCPQATFFSAGYSKFSFLSSNNITKKPQLWVSEIIFLKKINKKNITKATFICLKTW